MYDYWILVCLLFCYLLQFLFTKDLNGSTICYEGSRLEEVNVFRAGIPEEFVWIDVVGQRTNEVVRRRGSYLVE